MIDSSPKALRVVRELGLIVVALLVVAPVALIFVTALKPDAEIVHFDSVLPHRPTLENFRYLSANAEESPVLWWLLNSFLIAGGTTLLVLTVTSLAAYGLARLAPPGGRYVFGLIVGTMMVPGQVLLVPVYLLLNRLGWLDTYAALIIPAGASAFGVFLLHQFFKAIPKELEEAAELDGCSRLQTFWHVALPLSKPALATLAILTFVGSWNDFIGPLVFLDSIDKFTLPVGIALFQSSYTNQYGLTLAASVICTTPVLVIFLLFNRVIISGIAAGAVKE